MTKRQADTGKWAAIIGILSVVCAAVLFVINSSRQLGVSENKFDAMQKEVEALRLIRDSDHDLRQQDHETMVVLSHDMKTMATILEKWDQQGRPDRIKP